MLSSDKSAVLGSKFVVTNQSGRVGDVGKKYGAEDQWNLQTVSDQVKSFQFAKDGCDRKSSFYLKEYDGSDPSDAAKEFFIYMNNRAGDKFQLCKDGKVDTHGAIGLLLVNGNYVKNGHADPGSAYMSVDDFNNPKSPSMVDDVIGLKNILHKISRNGQVVFLGCLAGLRKEEGGKGYTYDGQYLGREMHKIKKDSTLYLSQALDNGPFNDGRTYYNYYQYLLPAITWGWWITFNGRDYVNHRPLGYLKFLKGSDKFVNLGSLETNDGNILISANTASIVEADKNGQSPTGQSVMYR